MSNQISRVISTKNGTEDGTENKMIDNKIESGINNKIEGDKQEMEYTENRKQMTKQNTWKIIENICNRKHNKIEYVRQ